jgi:hypothetical protein
MTRMIRMAETTLVVTWEDQLDDQVSCRFFGQPDSRVVFILSLGGGSLISLGLLWHDVLMLVGVSLPFMGNSSVCFWFAPTHNFDAGPGLWGAQDVG